MVAVFSLIDAAHRKQIPLNSLSSSLMASGEDFYVRYYVGHKGKFGHEFLEFEFRPDGKSQEAFKLKHCSFSFSLLCFFSQAS